jgi:hypothetical protein
MTEHKKRLAVLIVGIGLIGIVSGCGFQKERTAAESVAANVFENIKTGHIESVSAYYSPLFFRQTSKEEWESILQNMNKKLGTLESYELVNWNVRKQVNITGSGTYWLLQYNVQYSKYPATETLNIFKPIGGSEYKILGHNINSAAFLKE